MGKITIKHIAELSGVSIGTVDRVLHNRGQVNDQTKKRILEICDQYDYKMNHIGKAMAMQKKATVIAVVISNPKSNNFAAQVYAGLKKIHDEILDYNFEFRFYFMNAKTVEELNGILDEIEACEISGLIIKPINDDSVRERLNKFASKGISIVTIVADINDVSNKLCFVGQNHYKEGRIIANILTKLNYESLRIIILSGNLKVTSRRQKLDGFKSYLDEHRINYRVLDQKILSDSDTDVSNYVDEIISKNKEANAFYIHTQNLPVALMTLRENKMFRGSAFTYGVKESIGQFIADHTLDYAIYEDPFRYGYMAGKAIFDYIVSDKIPFCDEYVFDGTITFAENCF